MSGYQFIDHTADIAVRVWAQDIGDLVLQASRALLEITFEVPLEQLDSDGAQVVDIRVTGTDRASLLVAFMNEILYYLEGEGQILLPQEVLSMGEGNLSVRARSVSVQLGPGIAREVKAATHHDIAVSKNAETGLWETTVVFDL